MRHKFLRIAGPDRDACKRYLIVLRYCTFEMAVALHSRHQRPLRRTGEMRWFAAAIAALVSIAHLAVLLHFVTTLRRVFSACALRMA